MSILITGLIILILITVLFRTYKSNKMILNILIALLIALSFANIPEITKLYDERNAYAMYTYNTLYDSIGDLSVYKTEIIEDMDDVYNLSGDIDSIIINAHYFEKNIKYLKFKNIDATALRLNIVKLKISLVEFSDYIRRLSPESDLKKVESNLEYYNALVDNLVALSRLQHDMSTLYHNKINVLTYELRFDEKDGDAITETVLEIERLITEFIGAQT